MKGERRNPFSLSEYDQLCRSHAWEGGWVSRPIGLAYITASQRVVPDDVNDPLGEPTNPFPVDVYNEMVEKRTWTGGYVQQEGDPEPVYHRGLDEETDGCGCGCEEGCGEGSGSGSGNGTIISGREHFHMWPFDFDLVWGQGLADGHSVSLDFEGLQNCDPDSVTLTEFYNPAWLDNYTVALRGTYRYKLTNSTNTISAEFIIPETFRD